MIEIYCKIFYYIPVKCWNGNEKKIEVDKWREKFNYWKYVRRCFLNSSEWMSNKLIFKFFKQNTWLKFVRKFGNLPYSIENITNSLIFKNVVKFFVPRNHHLQVEQAREKKRSRSENERFIDHFKFVLTISIFVNGKIYANYWFQLKFDAIIWNWRDFAHFSSLTFN